MSEVKPTTKPPISLIPAEAIIEEAKAFQFGATKHGRFGFRDGVEFSKLIDAGLRHLLAIAAGEDIDEESKCYHAASVRANMAMLLWMMEHKPELDDRFFVQNKLEPTSAVETLSKALSDEQMERLNDEFAPPYSCVRCDRGDSHICYAAVEHGFKEEKYKKDIVMAGSKKK